MYIQVLTRWQDDGCKSVDIKTKNGKFIVTKSGVISEGTDNNLIALTVTPHEGLMANTSVRVIWDRDEDDLDAYFNTGINRKLYKRIELLTGVCFFDLLDILREYAYTGFDDSDNSTDLL